MRLPPTFEAARAMPPPPQPQRGLDQPRRRGRHPEANQLVVRLDPSTGIRLVLDAQRADGVEPEAITLDMEFALQGGEGPTPYEVLLHATIIGDSSRFADQSSVEESWRIVATAPRRTATYRKLRPGQLGAGRRHQARRGPRRMARPLARPLIVLSSDPARGSEPYRARCQKNNTNGPQGSSFKPSGKP